MQIHTYIHTYMNQIIFQLLLPDLPSTTSLSLQPYRKKAMIINMLLDSILKKKKKSDNNWIANKSKKNYFTFFVILSVGLHKGSLARC